jgi:hypothetical protein
LSNSSNHPDCGSRVQCAVSLYIIAAVRAWRKWTPWAVADTELVFKDFFSPLLQDQLNIKKPAADILQFLVWCKGGKEFYLCPPER